MDAAVHVIERRLRLLEGLVALSHRVVVDRPAGLAGFPGDVVRGGFCRPGRRLQRITQKPRAAYRAQVLEPKKPAFGFSFLFSSRTADLTAEHAHAPKGLYGIPVAVTLLFEDSSPAFKNYIGRHRGRRRLQGKVAGSGRAIRLAAPQRQRLCRWRNIPQAAQSTSSAYPGRDRRLFAGVPGRLFPSAAFRSGSFRRTLSRLALELPPRLSQGIPRRAFRAANGARRI